MNRASLIAFIRSLSWKEWLAFVSITALHVWAGLYYGVVGVVIQLVIGCCVALLLIGAFRILAKADRDKVR